MIEPDSLQRFLFEHANIRGEIVRFEKTYETILKQHKYPPTIKKILGEALMSAALLAGSIQFEGELSIQFHGDERLPLLVVQCDHELHLRGFAKFKKNSDNSLDYERAFLDGKMVMIINKYNNTKAYQSVVPIHKLSMADNLTHYFAQSEQIATRVWLATSEHQAAGLLLQLMPEQNTLQREQFWEYAVKIGETITDHELFTLDNEIILYRLYHETELRLFPARYISFRCRCNLKKMQQALSVLGKKDADELIKEQNEIEITCDFCNKKYVFDAIDSEMVFRSSLLSEELWAKKI
jgi:molecular chaperone Hsp33